MEEKKQEAIIEAILFTVGESVELDKIAAVLELDKEKTKTLVEHLRKRYESDTCGMKIIELDGAYQMCTKAEYYEYLIKIAKQPKKRVLTDVLLETLSIIACNLCGHRDMVCPLMDARRNQTYTGLYTFDGNKMQVELAQCAVGIDEIVEKINEKQRAVVFLGDGVPVFETYIREQINVPYTFAPAHVNKQRAAAVAALGEIYYKEGKTETAAEHRPDYLRLSQAERERMERENAKHA